MEITKTTPIAEIIERAPEAMAMFRQLGMHCMGCALASGENVGQACAAHGYDADEFVANLNAFIQTI